MNDFAAQLTIAAGKTRDREKFLEGMEAAAKMADAWAYPDPSKLAQSIRERIAELR